MAQGKKSFILYTDLLEKIEALTIEERGILFTHLLEYVNDKNPVLTDRLLVTAWKNIELDLKRDLKKYEQVKDSKVNAGRLGNLKRWNIDLYNDVLSNSITIEEAEEIAKHRKISHSDTVRQKTSHSIANVAVNDNVNDNVINNNNNMSSKLDRDNAISFINFFNAQANRNFRYSKKIESSLRARLKDYSKEEIATAVRNAHSEQYHIESGYKHLTPEFILRPDKLEKYLNVKGDKTKFIGGYTPKLTN